jgi:PPK2 family polyphosphate:nucleotide phosphotransferase
MGQKEGIRQLIERAKVQPGTRVDLELYPTSWEMTEEDSINGMTLSKENAEELLAKSLKELTAMQEVLWADNHFSLLIILQGMDAAGKDGIIKHVMSGVNPQGCQVTSFKAPSADELEHDFLWRCIKVLPGKGSIGIFNRSYYEEVLVVRVHQEFLHNQNLPTHDFGQSFWKERYHSINEMEKHLVRNGMVIIKLFLNVSKEEQRTRLIERIATPEKVWKFNPNDVRERDLWPEYMESYQEMIEATSTEHAPWYILPADQKWLARLLAALILTGQIKSLGLSYPELPKEYMDEVQEAKSRLEKG